MKALRLSVMMFLEFMALPVWFVPMFPYVQALPGGADWAVWCGISGTLGWVASGVFSFVGAKAFGLVDFVSAGVGVFFSNVIFDALLKPAADGSHPWPLAYAVALGLAILAAVLMSVCFRPACRHK